MKDEQLLRYSRQIMLPQMDVAGQQKLIDATVLIVGMGGLGCPAAMYLAAAGVGHLIIADDDLVELTNLQRQIAHSESMIGEPKVVSAQQTLLGLNPDLKITALQKSLEGSELSEVVGQADLIVDALTISLPDLRSIPHASSTASLSSREPPFVWRDR